MNDKTSTNVCIQYFMRSENIELNDKINSKFCLFTFLSKLIALKFTNKALSSSNVLHKISSCQIY